MEKIRVTAYLKNKKTGVETVRNYGDFELTDGDFEKAIDLAVYDSKYSKYLIKSLSANGTVFWVNRDCL